MIAEAEGLVEPASGLPLFGGAVKGPDRDVPAGIELGQGMGQQGLSHPFAAALPGNSEPFDLVVRKHDRDAAKQGRAGPGIVLPHTECPPLAERLLQGVVKRGLVDHGPEQVLHFSCQSDPALEIIDSCRLYVHDNQHLS